MLTYFLIFLQVLIVVGCKTTAGGIVDEQRQEITVLSSGDTRSPDFLEQSTSSSYERAIAKLEDALKEKPRDVSKLLAKAQLELTQQKYEAARLSCQKALRVDLKNQEARKILAEISLRQGMWDQAEIHLMAVGGNQAKDSRVLNMLALLALHREQNSLGLQLLKEAIKMNPNDIAARMNLGVQYLKYRQLSQAAVQFERVLKVSPQDGDARLHLAITQAARGKNEEAVAVFNQYANGSRPSQIALYNLAVSQKKMGALDDAVASLRRYIKAAPGASPETEQALALVEDINRIKADQGQEVRDDEIHSLAAELKSKPAAKQPEAEHKKEPAAATAKETEKTAPVTAPASEVEDEAALEKIIRQ